MADLRRASFWDRLLLPAFVYYFKLLYPFALSNSPLSWVAAAAGGCVLADTATLERAEGLRRRACGALIDDCTLAPGEKDRCPHLDRPVARRGKPAPYGSLRSCIHDMVARSAYTQLRYSPLLLAAVTLIFAAAYWLPLVALFVPGAGWLAASALLAMAAGYWPTLRYYGLSPLWLPLLPWPLPCTWA